jgi:hypothetical protein
MDDRGGTLAGASAETRKRAEAAKSYIENMYKVQQHNISERRERWVPEVYVSPRSPSVRQLFLGREYEHGALSRCVFLGCAPLYASSLPDARMSLM